MWFEGEKNSGVEAHKFGETDLKWVRLSFCLEPALMFGELSDIAKTLRLKQFWLIPNEFNLWITRQDQQKEYNLMYFWIQSSYPQQKKNILSIDVYCILFSANFYERFVKMYLHTFPFNSNLPWEIWEPLFFTSGLETIPCILWRW